MRVIKLNTYDPDSNKRIQTRTMQLPSLKVATGLDTDAAKLMMNSFKAAGENEEGYFKPNYLPRLALYDQLWEKVRKTNLILPVTALAVEILAVTNQPVPRWMEKTELSLEDQHRICWMAYQPTLFRRFINRVYGVKLAVFDRNIDLFYRLPLNPARLLKHTPGLILLWLEKYDEEVPREHPELPKGCVRQSRR